MDERSFYGVILATIEAELGQHGYHVLFSTLGDHVFPRCVEERRVEGLFILGTDVNEPLARSLAAVVPVVLVDHVVAGITSMVGDNVGGARLATAPFGSRAPGGGVRGRNLGRPQLSGPV